MAIEVISNVDNKYLFGKESTYGTIPGSITQLDIGHVQSISIDEDEGTERNDSMNSGFTPTDFEDGVYNVSGQIVTRATKASIPVILEAILGTLTDNSDDTYTMTTNNVSSDALSYCMKVNNTTGKTLQIAGISFTGGEGRIEKDGFFELTMNYQAQIVKTATETIDPSTTIGSPFHSLDSYVTYDGNATILDSFNFSIDWGFDISDSRGIEAAHANGRRVIKRVVRHNMTLEGSFESKSDDNIDTGYIDERTSVDIVLVVSRGTSNEHTFTISTSRTKTRSRELNNDSETRVLSADFVGKDISVTGDY